MLLALAATPLLAPVFPASSGAEGAAQPTVYRSTFGQLPDGRLVDLFTLTNAAGLRAQVMTYGATLLAVEVPDREGRRANVTLDLDTFGDYLAGHPLLGSTVGRYANRIDTGGFTIDGVRHDLETFNRRTGVHIHGGREGFHKLLWAAEARRGDDSAEVVLTHTSPAGHEGFPGGLSVTVIYRLTNAGELIFEYRATTDAPTHVNLTNHAYWNLAGAGSGDVLGHRLRLHADHFLPADGRKIPTGERRPVAGTPMDFRQLQMIGAHIAEVPGGYDHCYVIDPHPGDGGPAPAARVEDPASGRVMEVFTTQPGVQLYTANGLSDRYSSGGRPYGRYHGLCLETQAFPDSPNKPGFPSTLLHPGEAYHQVTIHRFGVAE